MINYLCITDLGDEQVRLSWQRGEAAPRLYPHPIPCINPVDIDDLTDIQWYLEQYLHYPFEEERYRAQKIEQTLARWGSELFTQVFIRSDRDPDPYAFYTEAMDYGLDTCLICITSEDPAFLDIPWELLKDPEREPGHLAPLLRGMYRHLAGHEVDMPELSATEPFRVLLIMSRPFGERDNAFATVSRPFLAALEPLRNQIEFDVLRPPTFKALQEHFTTSPGRYRLVHFDGQALFHRTGDYSVAHSIDSVDTGYLALEREDGKEDLIDGRRLGQLLANSGIPLFVINAYRSAQMTVFNPFTSLASQLIANGVKGVVVTPYPFCSTAAELFMGRFYAGLAKHRLLAEAVTDARRALEGQPGRESVTGSTELKDWIIPVLYQREHRYVPLPESCHREPIERDRDETPARPRVAEVCPEGRYGFVGRDYDMLRIERLLHDKSKPWVLITGPGGIGKTELAFGFARWYAESEGCPGGVFVTSFREKADFGQVLGSIIGYGTSLVSLSDKQHWEKLISYLRENRCLLIWDNIELVAGYPESAVPLATEEEQGKLARFLQELMYGQSRVLLLTRKSEEKWVGVDYQPMHVTGFSEREAVHLANFVLESVECSPENFANDPHYYQLLKLLQRHPRSIEIVLPQLVRTSPTLIIEALNRRMDELGESLHEASLNYAFSSLSTPARMHLPFLGLFSSKVNVTVLGNFTDGTDERRNTYLELMQEPIDAVGWEALLKEAGYYGLIRPLGNRTSEMHALLLSFLRRRLFSLVDRKGLSILNDEFMEFYASGASHFLKGVRKKDPTIIEVIRIEESNLIRALRMAEINKRWLTAQTILGLLGEFYKTVGRSDEWTAFQANLILRIGQDLDADSDRDRANLWIYLLSSEAHEARAHDEFKTAESIYAKILSYLYSLHDPAVESKIALIHHQLGLVAEVQDKFERAEKEYMQAIEIFKGLNLQSLLANTLNHLGILHYRRKNFHQAMVWYGMALTITAEHNIKTGKQIVTDLARIMKDIGEDDFKIAWRKAFKEQETLLNSIIAAAKTPS